MREVLDAEVISHEPKFLNKICTVSLVAKSRTVPKGWHEDDFQKDSRYVSQLRDWEDDHSPDSFASELA